MPQSWLAETYKRPGVNLRYHRSGRGDRPALVLLHGATDNGLCWYKLARAFEADFDVVMPDARGHGETETDAPSFTMAGMVDDTAELITHLGMAPATVMGHSMGAQMATELAARYPELVDRVVLEDPAFRFSTANNLRTRLFMLAIELSGAYTRHRSPEQIQRTANRIFKKWSVEDTAPWAVAQYQFARQRSVHSLRNAFDPERDWNALLSAIEAPTLLVTAEKGLVKDDEATSILSRLRDGSGAHIARAAHNVRRDNYPDFMAAVSPFVLRPPADDDPSAPLPRAEPKA